MTAKDVAPKLTPSEAAADGGARTRDHTELKSSLWSAFSAANDCRSKVMQVEQNFCNLQAQSQLAVQKSDEALVAVQHWAGMVEQCRMEHAAVQTPFYEPHFQAQAQQRLATAMQSHSFAVQSSERAQQHKATADAAMRDAADMLMTVQADLRHARGELEEVVQVAEDFLKMNAASLPQDKAQPLWGLCTRFKQFAQQLGAQEEARAAKPATPEPFQGLAHMQPKQPGGLHAEALHPLADYQQRVMIVEEESRPLEEEPPMDLFGGEEEDDLQSSGAGAFGSFVEGGCQAGEFSTEQLVDGGVAVPEEAKKEDLAAMKNRLLSEASYLQAVFGGKKEEN